MNRLVLIITIVIVLIVGGALTTMLSDPETPLLPFLQQTHNPEASAMHAEPWQAEQFFLMVGFILFNLIGIGVTIAVVMWLLHRQVVISKATPSQEESEPERTVERQQRPEAT